MQNVKPVEVHLYLYQSWAMALIDFAEEVLRSNNLPPELKGAFIEMKEAFAEAGFYPAASQNHS